MDPIAWLQNKNEEIIDLDGNIPELVTLNLVPDCAAPIIATRNMNIKRNRTANIWIPKQNERNLFSNSYLSQAKIDEVENEEITSESTTNLWKISD